MLWMSVVASLGNFILHCDRFYLLWMDSIDENNAFNYIRNPLCAIQPSPAGLGRLRQLEDHRKGRFTRATSLRPFGAMAHR